MPVDQGPVTLRLREDLDSLRLREKRAQRWEPLWRPLSPTLPADYVPSTLSDLLEGFVSLRFRGRGRLDREFLLPAQTQVFLHRPRSKKVSFQTFDIRRRDISGCNFARAILRLRYIVVRCRSCYVLYGWDDGAEQKKIENQEPVENEIWRDFGMFFDSRKHHARQSLNYRHYRSWYTSDSITKRCLNASYVFRFIYIALCQNTFVNFHLRRPFYKENEPRHKPSGMQTRKV